ncbi:unnamed protein product, partial [Meganyctiphanes norvegica]
HLANTPVMSYDPPPPSDSVCSYTRPHSEDRPNAANSSSMLTTFFRSLMPNYDPSAPEPQLGELVEGGGAAEGGGELRKQAPTHSWMLCGTSLPIFTYQSPKSMMLM